MAFDDNLVLRDGVIDLQPAEVAAVLLTSNADGAKVLDIQKTGPQGLAAVLICPDAPTDYADTLTVVLQHSHHYARGFAALATFPVMYAYVMRVRGTATIVFTSADIGEVLVSTDDAACSTGVILWYDKALETVGGVGDVLVAMADAGDNYDEVDGDTLTSAGGGTMTQVNKAAARDRTLSYGVVVMRFVTDQRYIRATYTVTAGGNWGNVQCLISNSPYLDL